MCGSLISKLVSRNKVDPVRTTLPDPTRIRPKIAKAGTVFHENREFWKKNDFTDDSDINSRLSAGLKNSMKKNGVRSTSGSSSQQEGKLRALNHSKQLLPAINTTSVILQKQVQRDSQHLLESAREILGLQANHVTSSNSNDVTLKSFSSIDSSKPINKTTLAFGIPVTK